MPKVAIITRTKDRPLLLERAILSVLNQSFEDWMHLIVNDGGDKVDVENLEQKYQERYNGRLKIIHNEISKGADRVINFGINNSEGDYVVLLDDDDSWEKDFLKECISAFEGNYDGVMSHSNYVIEKVNDESIEVIQKYPFNSHIEELNLTSVVLGGFCPPPVSFVFKRSVYELLGGFNEEFEKAGDAEFILRFLGEFKAGVVKKPLANYHFRPYNQGAQANVTQSDNQDWVRKISKSLFEHSFSLGLTYLVLSLIKPIRDFIVIAKKISALKGKKTALYGAGTRANQLWPLLKRINIVGFLDNSKEKQEQGFNGYKVFAPDDIDKLNPDVIVFSIANHMMVLPFVQKILDEKNMDCEIVILR